MREHLQSESNRAFIRKEVRDALVAFFRFGHGCGRLSGKRKQQQWLHAQEQEFPENEDGMVFHDTKRRYLCRGVDDIFNETCVGASQHRVRRGTR